jgi:LmbE family N-acetylglucosaminyl deacetylase
MASEESFEEIASQYERALVIAAHPDDPEFFAGGTVARLTQLGLTVKYLILTRGDKGSDDRDISDEELAATRRQEQSLAAEELGVEEVVFLDNPDGFLEKTYDVLRDTVRVIRQFQPDIILTTDPERLYSSWGVSHRDHRTAGMIVLDAVFPAARNHRFFPELLKEGLEPHKVHEIWISRGAEADLEVDTSDVYDLRTKALTNHRSQVGDSERFTKRMNERRENSDEPPTDRFRRVTFR